jgi:hypothetical protein
MHSKPSDAMLRNLNLSLILISYFLKNFLILFSAHAMVRAISRRCITAKVRVKSPASPCGIYGNVTLEHIFL